MICRPSGHHQLSRVTLGAVQQFFDSFKQYPPHQISFDMDTSEIVDEMVRNAPQ